MGLVSAIVLMIGSAGADEAVYTNKARFRIPYQLDAAEIARLRAEEIQLHVTTDQAKRWRHVDSVPPVDGKFTFEAAQDGEYWFAVRTIGKDGREHPAGPLKPGLKVRVDTSSPTMNLELSEAATGKVGLRWNTADDYLDVVTLVLEYREADSSSWEAIQVVPTVAGETMWSVPAGGAITVRGRIRDRAGNEISEQTSLTMTGAAAPTAPAQPPSQSSIAQSQPLAAPNPAQPATESTSPIAPQYPASGALPRINPGDDDYSHFVSQQGTQPPAVRQPNWDPQSQTSPLLNQPANVRRVNSTSFQIGYALDDVGPSGISSVDLYLSEDQGRKWFHYGVDEDGTSPFKVTVSNDGSYGFAIRVRSGVGLAQAPPQPGDAPEVTIVVDREPPQVSLLPLKQGHGQLPNQVLIEWTLSDAQLADRPVALYYAPRLSGPWQPITGWEPDSGEYVWTFGPQTPKQVYIRLEARDAAGNISRVETPEPMLVDLSRPTARIIDVESLAPRN